MSPWTAQTPTTPWSTPPAPSATRRPLVRRRGAHDVRRLHGVERLKLKRDTVSKYEFTHRAWRITDPATSIDVRKLGSELADEPART